VSAEPRASHARAGDKLDIRRKRRAGRQVERVGRRARGRKGEGSSWRANRRASRREGGWSTGGGRIVTRRGGWATSIRWVREQEGARVGCAGAGGREEDSGVEPPYQSRAKTSEGARLSANDRKTKQHFKCCTGERWKKKEEIVEYLRKDMQYYLSDWISIFCCICRPYCNSSYFKY
jgi:hypothetical protein